MKIRVEKQIGAGLFWIETGELAKQAHGSCLIGYDDVCVLCATTTAPSKPGADFFRLTCEYRERGAAAGKFPGGFLKREGRPGLKEVLTARLIDRPIRPLFPKDLRNDVVVVATVLSVEQDNDPLVAAFLGTAVSLAISDIPFNGPVASVNVGIVDGEIVINPTLEQRAQSELTLTVSSTADLVAMIEAGGNEIPDDLMFDCIMAGHEVNKEVVKFINGIVAEIGKPKFDFISIHRLCGYGPKSKGCDFDIS